MTQSPLRPRKIKDMAISPDAALECPHKSTCPNKPDAQTVVLLAVNCRIPWAIPVLSRKCKSSGLPQSPLCKNSGDMDSP